MENDKIRKRLSVDEDNSDELILMVASCLDGLKRLKAIGGLRVVVDMSLDAERDCVNDVLDSI